MIHRPAQYLLRFDDLCPTMSRARWAAFESLIDEFRIRPILAVVPANRDPELIVDTPDPGFWQRMRACQSVGAAIALHGFRHICENRGRSLLPLHRTSEFAGVPFATQRAWIHEGLEILRRHGLSPHLFVAPRHGFDQNTLHTLRHEGIAYISDGLSRVPFARDGVTWIPQQLWAPVVKPAGLWTICIHTNTATDESLRTLRTFLAAHASQFTCFDRLIADSLPKRLSPSELLYEKLAHVRIMASPLLKRSLQRVSLSASYARVQRKWMRLA